MVIINGLGIAKPVTVVCQRNRRHCKQEALYDSEAALFTKSGK